MLLLSVLFGAPVVRLLPLIIFRERSGILFFMFI